MSLKAISESLDRARDNMHGFSWVDEEFSELLILVAEHILQKEDIGYAPIPKGFVSLSEFEKKYKFIAAHSIGNHCRKNKRFNLECCLYIQKKWYVNEEKTLQYFKNITLFKKRIERLGKS